MKTLVVNALGRGFDFQEVQIAEPIGREALVKVQASGLCHTDSLVATHDLVPLPAVLGHEVADIVAAVGPDVTQLRVGDHAVGSLAQACGACARCLSDRPVQRTHPEATLSQRSLSQGSAARLRRRNGRRNTANVRAGETVVLFGADGIGLNAVSGARIAGATRIIVIDIKAQRLDEAKRFGATDVIDSTKTKPVEAFRALLSGGADHVFDFCRTEISCLEATGLHGAKERLARACRCYLVLRLTYKENIDASNHGDKRNEDPHDSLH